LLPVPSTPLEHKRRSFVRVAAQLAVVVVLLCLGVANMSVRATWTEVEDGVLWATSGADVVAREVAPGSTAGRAGLRAGDLLLAIDGVPVASPADVVSAFHAASRGAVLTYSVLRMAGAPQLVQVPVQQIPAGAPRPLYFALAAVGIFSLLVGAAVRLRRPEQQATLHF
jgi:predicted metalloprotease with PDZ domain